MPFNVSSGDLGLIILGRGFWRATEVCESAGAGDDEVEQSDE